MQETQDPHYLRAVTELSDTRKIVASCDIYSQSGIKLISSGVRISSSLYERLVCHKPLPRLDMALTVENVLNQKTILDDVLDLIKTSKNLEDMLTAIGKSSRLSRIILSIQLPDPLAFKLTVAREKYARIYQHSLLLLIAGIYLAHCDGMNSQEIEWVAAAALFQDIGLLHIDPKLLEPSHQMSPEERRHLYAHPLTAYLILGEFPEVSGKIARAVFEHHERMDGSGYPRGLLGEKISRYGQILAVSELIAKAFNTEHPGGQWKKLETILKLNSRRYGNGLIGHVTFHRDDLDTEETSESSNLEHLTEQIRLIGSLFEKINLHSDPGRQDEVLVIAQTRLAALRLELLDAGFDPNDPDQLLQLFADDPDCIPGYAPLLNETLWRFKSLIIEISRLWPAEIDKKNPLPDNPERTWLDEMKLLLIPSTQNVE